MDWCHGWDKKRGSVDSMRAFLNYSNKRSKEEIINSDINFSYTPHSFFHENKLIHGDNFKGLKFLSNSLNMDGRIDLIYIDPPFSTNNVFRIGEKTNTISSSSADDIAYNDRLKGEEYLEFMWERLVLLHQLLSDKGSIYVHIDYKVGHYIKILMDELFGVENFRGDISRIKCSPKNFKRKAYGNVKDMILFYSKSDNYTWNYPTVPFTDDDIHRLYKKVDDDGRRYTTVSLSAPGETKDGVTGQEWRGVFPPKGRHWCCSPDKLDELDLNGLVEWSSNGVPRRKMYADSARSRGKVMQDVWEFKDPQHPVYPTEKNMDMVKKIISASSCEGDVVLDCFAGSGTSLVASQELGRWWIGVDESVKAVDLIRRRLDVLGGNLFNSGLYDFVEVV